MAILPHPLAERHGAHLVVSGWTAGELNSFHNGCFKALGSFEDAAQLARDVDPDLKDAPRRAQQGSILANARRKLMATVQAELQGVTSAVERKRTALAEKSMAKPPDNPTEAIMAGLKAMDLRQQLQAMDPANASKAIRASAQLGDRSVIDAAKSMLVPVVAPEIIDLAEDSYQSIAASDELEQLAMAEEVAANAEFTVRRICEVDSIATLKGEASSPIRAIVGDLAAVLKEGTKTLEREDEHARLTAFREQQAAPSIADEPLSFDEMKAASEASAARLKATNPKDYEFLRAVARREIEKEVAAAA